MKGCPEFNYEKKRGPSGRVTGLVNDIKKVLSPYWGSF
jgi:hypothetical protein